MNFALLIIAFAFVAVNWIAGNTNGMIAWSLATILQALVILRDQILEAL